MSEISAGFSDVFSGYQSLIYTNELSHKIEISPKRDIGFSQKPSEIVSSNVEQLFIMLSDIISRYKVPLDVNILDVKDYLSNKSVQYAKEIEEKIIGIAKSRKSEKIKKKEIINVFIDIKNHEIKVLENTINEIRNMTVLSPLPLSLIGDFILFLTIAKRLNERLWEIVIHKVNTLLTTTSKKYPGRDKIVRKRKENLLDRYYRIEYFSQLIYAEKCTRLSFLATMLYLILPYIKSKDEITKVSLAKLDLSYEKINRDGLRELTTLFKNNLKSLIEVLSRTSAEFKKEPLIEVEPLSPRSAETWAIMVGIY